MQTIPPALLLEDSGSKVPRHLRPAAFATSQYAAQLGARHAGPDFEVDSFRPLSTLSDTKGGIHAMTYLSSGRYAPELESRSGLVVVTTDRLRSCVPHGNALLLTSDDPRAVFYAALEFAIQLRLFECLETFISDSARVARSAVVYPNVYIDESAQVDPGVVLLPNTYVGPNVIVKPNAVIGGDGFEAAHFASGRRIVRHAGGVWLSDGAQIGSCTCVDKGLFGDFTVVGQRTLVDNLVHFAHSARAGESCSIVACAEISGSAILGRGVWVGPNASINQGLSIGDYSYIGTASVVTRDLAPHSLAYGSPAKLAGRVCECRTKLSFDSGRAICEACRREYVLTEDALRRV